ncbi:MAG: phosphate ABC transporter permease PstA [Oligoflexia bacterium]|nr:phosphate ABC transporter permease PstA [Oligoflexia bacterium]
MNIRNQLAANDGRRRLKNQIMCAFLFLAAIVAIAPLVSVFVYVVQRGYQAMSWDFFTQLPAAVGSSGGGMANAITGTMVLVALASLIGVPVGICGGLYLSEFGANSKIASTLRFGVDILASVPSIIVGLFAYAVVVMPMKRPSALAGGFALAILMIPTVARTSEALLKLVPVHIREAGLALGIPRWKVIIFIVLRGSMGAIITGIMLGIARAAGETAPLLLTAAGSQHWSHGLDQPIASLPVQIYTFAISPYDEWQKQAWAGAFVLVLFVFVLNIGTRLIIKRPTIAKD